MHITKCVSVGDLVEVPNGAIALVTSVDSSKEKPIGVLFDTGEFINYKLSEVHVISSYLPPGL